MTSGMLCFERASMAAGDLLAHHRAHTAADELQLQRADVDVRPLILPAAEMMASRRSVAFCIAARRSLYGFESTKLKRIGGSEIPSSNSSNSVVKEVSQAGMSVDAEMIAALRTQLQAFIQRLPPDDLIAAVALCPQAFRRRTASSVGVRDGLFRFHQLISISILRYHAPSTRIRVAP